MGWSQHELIVFDAHDSIPLAGAHIYDSVSGKGYITNKEGRVFKPDKEGSWTVSYLGYQTKYYSAFEPYSEVFLNPQPRALEEVRVYGLDLKQLLRRNLKSFSPTDTNRHPQKFVLRIISRTNNRLTQLIQTQLMLFNQDLWMIGIDFARLPHDDQALSAAGYLEIGELIQRTDPAYPLHLLIRFLEEYSIDDIRTDSNTSIICFSGVLKDQQGQRYPLQKARLVVDTKEKRIRKLEWQIPFDGHFENRRSSRYREAYAIAYLRASEKYSYGLAAKSAPRLIEVGTTFSMRLKQGHRIDSVFLQNHMLFPSVEKGTAVTKKRHRRLKMDKPLLDQLKNVPLGEQNFLLTQEEQKFINNHDE